MKRKILEVDGCVEQSERDYNYKLITSLQKRKASFSQQEPNAKRFHSYNQLEEQTRYIGQLEHVLKELMMKVKELEYQLEVNRNASECLKINYIESY